MAWWNRLFGRTPKKQENKPTFPIQVELIPEKLTARVYLHQIDAPTESISCWTYLSEGLFALQQKEVIFTLRKEREESAEEFPQDPFNLFKTLYQLAQNTQLVDIGGFTQFGARSFLGRHLIYIRPQPLADIPIPQFAITAILVTKEEVIAAHEFGFTRVMARLGQASRYYPCPPWSDRHRSGLSFEANGQESILKGIPRLRIPGVRVTQMGSEIVLSVPQRSKEQWKSLLAQQPTNTPLGLLTDLDPQANACLVWEPGQSGGSAITPPNSDASRRGGCFLVIFRGQNDNEGRIVEDGFVMMLTDSSWSSFQQALMNGQPITIPSTNDNLSVSLDWWETAYYNPIDEKTYVPSGAGRLIDHNPPM